MDDGDDVDHPKFNFNSSRNFHPFTDVSNNRNTKIVSEIDMEVKSESDSGMKIAYDSSRASELEKPKKSDLNELKQSGTESDHIEGDDGNYNTKSGEYQDEGEGVVTRLCDSYM